MTDSSPFRPSYSSLLLSFDGYLACDAQLRCFACQQGTSSKLTQCRGLCCLTAVTVCPGFVLNLKVCCESSLGLCLESGKVKVTNLDLTKSFCHQPHLVYVRKMNGKNLKTANHKKWSFVKERQFEYL